LDKIILQAFLVFDFGGVKPWFFAEKGSAVSDPFFVLGLPKDCIFFFGIKFPWVGVIEILAGVDKVGVAREVGFLGMG
jgi:hypothetical protein